MRALLRAAFPDGPPDIPPRADQLTALQRQAVAALAAAPDACQEATTLKRILDYKLTHLLPTT